MEGIGWDVKSDVLGNRVFSDTSNNILLVGTWVEGRKEWEDMFLGW